MQGPPSSFTTARAILPRVQPLSGPRRPSHVVQRFVSHDAGDGSHNATEGEAEPGAMSQRLSQMSEENVETGGRSARQAVVEAGFSEELKSRLEQKIVDASFRNDFAGELAQVNMPSGAPKHSRDIAAARPWAGTETVSDASLRMLNDAHKPMKVPVRTQSVRGPPSRIDTGRPKQRIGAGVRLANARDKTSIYSTMKDSGLSEKEREKLRQEMKQRFAPASRAVPATIQGLASLANERIEDAIARGQFRNLPRGKKIERDHNASSPFIDTTEYLMNKIIQKQEIVPPWIEKQQELVSTATRFRGRLRADWRRHVARVISSRGGNLDRQIQLANEYAFAELLQNPPKKKVEQINAVDEAGHMSQITLAGELKMTSDPDTPDAVEDSAKIEQEISIMEQTFNDDGSLKSAEQQMTIHTEPSSPSPVEAIESPESSGSPRRPSVPPFRDANWEQTERGYHTAAIDNLNAITRSYNLMAPSLARKPYFYLDRELKACFADVAPQIADAIRDRALAPKIKGIEVIGHKPGSVMDRLGAGNRAVVYDERKPQYGFKEFWKDLFASSAKN